MNAAPQLTALAEAMRARVRRDECNDPVIAGKRGNVHADGTGFSVAVMLDTPLPARLSNPAGATPCRV